MDCGHIETCFECLDDVYPDCMMESRNCIHCGSRAICPNCIDKHEYHCDVHRDCDCFEEDKDA